jgi:hypothetical protein
MLCWGGKTMLWYEAAALLVCAVGLGGFYYNMELSPKSPRRTLGGGKEFHMPDTRFHYTATELYDLFEQAGEEGRQKMRRYWHVDFGLIACFLVVMLAIGLNVAGRGTTLFTLMAVLAAVRCAFDLAENLLLLSLLRAYPRRDDGRATFAGAMTTAKFVCLYAWVVILFCKLFITAFHIG